MAKSAPSNGPDEQGFDLDSAVNRAWAEFQVSLADHISQMAPGDALVLENGYDDLGEQAEDHEPPDQGRTPSSGATGIRPCVQFVLDAGDRVRCEVPSNHFLHPRRTLTRAAERRLTELGWAPPSRSPLQPGRGGSATFRIDHPRTGADRLAAMAAAAFRDVWNVTHPSFLRADSGAGTAVALAYSADPPVFPEIDPLAAIAPRDTDHLTEIVMYALVPLLGVVPEQDSDGDIPIRSGGGIVFVRVTDTGISLFAPLVQDIVDRTRAAEVTGDLNRTWSGLKFVLADDRLSVLCDVPARPFVAQHLRDALDLCGAFVRTVDDRFAARLHGTAFFSDQDDKHGSSAARTHRRLTTGDLPVELLTLHDLDPEGTGTLDGATVAAVCGGSHQRIAHVLRMGNEWVAQFRRDAAETSARGDDAHADTLDRDGDTWERVVTSLRKALRLVNGRPGTEPETTVDPDDDDTRFGASGRHRPPGDT
ncbi:hypothetical protein DW322_17625 [Rhodococcus rhodnii]|uniref:Uncharacterized protein n=2 Tax=Rhodococcus rhodnii TaxID=38312 RepID=R7WLK6_9NOCA|nr:hypothetical protein [Rhodococcus rhodnii]EOM74869.1 hypothetical protein Rrhod_3746 [Rhodococcus rhodnii LMG 5362]TXG91678.1 hypothetical protein DW322_17625 [Rhodococcus rhodnii]